MVTRAKKVDGGYIVNGAKMWITSAPIAGCLRASGQSPDAHDDQIKGFILERGMKGLSAPKIEGKLSLRASITGEIVMEDVFVPEENLLPNVAGLKGPFGRLNSARYGIAWAHWALRKLCWHGALNYTIGTQAVRPPAGRKPAYSEKAG